MCANSYENSSNSLEVVPVSGRIIGSRLQLIYERAGVDGVVGVWIVGVRPQLSRQPQTLTTLILTDSATAWCSCTARYCHSR